MDKDFKPIEQLYLNQEFDVVQPEQAVAECKMIARSYALAENAVVSMGDNRRGCSYCYFGGLADVLGIAAEERSPEIPSLYESFIFDRCQPDDLAKRHADEVAFIHFLRTAQKPSKYRDNVLCNYLRLKDARGEYRWVKHRMFSLLTASNGSFRLNACVYTLATDEDRKTKFINTRTGEVRILTNKDYENVLSMREREVLRLIDEGLLSKEIAERLCISINTVNRHRQNILEKLQVDHAIEACRVARTMGLFAQQGVTSAERL